jgi:hypothetical protein
MKMRFLIVSVLATALTLQAGFAMAIGAPENFVLTATAPTPGEENAHIDNQQQFSDNQSVTQQHPPATTDNEQGKAPVILRIRIIKPAD